MSISLEEYEKFNVLGVDFVTRVSDSHLLESESLEEYRIIDCPGRGLHHMFPCSTSCSVRQWIHVRTSVYAGVWDCFFKMEVDSGS